jgi:hypothetical protein
MRNSISLMQTQNLLNRLQQLSAIYQEFMSNHHMKKKKDLST